MKQLLRFRVLALLLLCAAVCNAENVEHEFRTMGAAITYSPSNKIATTSLTTYTCTGGKKTQFWLDLIYNTDISINLPDANDFVTTSAIEDLSGIKILHYPNTKDKAPCTNIILQLSRDSVHWTEPIQQDGMYTKSWIDADFVPGRYYVRLTNTTSKSVSLYKIIYRFGSGCNCVLYIPE